MKKKFVSCIVLTLLLQTCLLGQTLQVNIVNTGSNHIQVTGTAIGDFQASDGTDDWSSAVLTLRIPTSVGASVSAPAASPSVTNESNSGFGGVTLTDGFGGGLAGTKLYALTQISGTCPSDGYVYMTLTDNLSTPNFPLSNGSTVVLFEFDLPVSWTCTECIEIVLTDISCTPFFDGTRFGNQGTGTNVVAAGDLNTNLPIELSFFDGASSKCDAALTWVTETEQNASHFEVQQSKDGRHFNTIGMVKAAGNSLSQQVYKYASAGGGNAYYRLKMVDADGTADFSDVIFIKAKDCRLKDLVLYPNPSKVGENFITAEVTLPQASDAKIYILDAVGKIHALKVVNLDATVNKISIETEFLTPGIYWVRVELPNEEPLFKSFICQ